MEPAQDRPARAERAERHGLPLRRTARIVLVDGLGRVLLFRFVDPDSDVPGGVWWGTVGGGVDEGESLPEAAARELREETGLLVPAAAFDRVIARVEGPTRYRGREEWYEHHFYFLRTEAFELDDSGWEEDERATMAEYRWWSAAELAATGEIVYPPGLAGVLPELLAGGLPAEPFDFSHP
jgi:8-oxo-dGTP pyrophosphatase MutT (NUDIX family)